MASSVFCLSRLAYVSFYILLGVLLVKQSTEFCGSVFESQGGHVLVGHIMSTVVVSDEFECHLKCLANSSCKSFNVHLGADHTKRICELNNKTRKIKQSDFKRKIGSTYYGLVEVSCADVSQGPDSGHCHPRYGGKHCHIGTKNCAELHKAGQQTSGVYTIKPDSGNAFDVYCDQTTAGGGWTVFQKRLDGSVDFYRGWDDYKRGFGNLSGEFWLGLDKIHRLTKEQSRLRVDLEDFNGATGYAEYSLFGVGDEDSKYSLSLGITYSGTAGDSLSYHRGVAFSTKDRDNDLSSGNCAISYKGAWWYTNCHSSNLNGRYLKGAHSSYADGVNWYNWKGHYYSVKRAEMKIKPVNA